jgi:hypothetical protein
MFTKLMLNIAYKGALERVKNILFRNHNRLINICV